MNRSDAAAASRIVRGGDAATTRIYQTGARL